MHEKQLALGSALLIFQKMCVVITWKEKMVLVIQWGHRTLSKLWFIRLFFYMWAQMLILKGTLNSNLSGRISNLNWRNLQVNAIQEKKRRKEKENWINYKMIHFELIWKLRFQGNHMNWISEHTKPLWRKIYTKCLNIGRG